MLEDTNVAALFGKKVRRSYGMRYLQRWQLGTSYPDIVEDVAKFLARPPLLGNRTVLAVDATGVGRPVVDQFARLSLKAVLVPITITGAQALGAHRDKKYGWRVPKKDLVGVLQMLLGQGRLKVAKIPERDTWVKELRTFKIKKDKETGNESWEGWRVGDKDDVVLSVAISAWLAERYWRDKMLLTLSFGKDKRKGGPGLHVVCCTLAELEQLDVDRAHRCVLIRLEDPAPATGEEVMCNGYNDLRGASEDPAVAQGEGLPTPPPSYNMNLLEALSLSFAPLDPDLYKSTWEQPVPGYGRKPEDLIMTADHGRKLWGLLTRRRGSPAPDVIVVAGGNDNRALSVCLGICDSLRVKRSIIYRPALPDADNLGSAEPPLRHVYNLVKATRGASF